MTKGKFITLEGGEGAGKSTQAKILADYLRGKGIEVVHTREPGGTPGAEAIRELWLTKTEGYWDSLTEVFLLMAARREHLVKKIWPALEKGTWVISERFLDSTRVYQGVALKIGVDVVNRLYQFVGGDFQPEMTLFLDLPVEIGLARIASRPNLDRNECKPASYHQILRDTLKCLAQQEPQRIKIIDASQDAAAVTAAIEKTIREHFKL